MLGSVDSGLKWSQSRSQIQTLKDCLSRHICCAQLGIPWRKIIGACCAVSTRSPGILLEEAIYDVRTWLRPRTYVRHLHGFEVIEFSISCFRDSHGPWPMREFVVSKNTFFYHPQVSEFVGKSSLPVTVSLALV